MSLGHSNLQSEMFNELTEFCEATLSQESIYSFLHRERHRLFPDEMFKDLYSGRGRRSIPPSMLASVMVLQRLEGLSDREAVERFSFDARWRYATGAGGYGEEGLRSFVHTVLVYMRERLRRSKDPERIFRAVLEAGKSAGLVGRKRVLDSTALYDSVATMDTITLIRSAIRGVLGCLEASVRAEVLLVLTSGDDYSTAAKPHIDWSDKEAREELIDSRACDGYACLEFLEERPLTEQQREAVELLATVLGQDLEVDEDGKYRIVRGVAKDRVLSTVDKEARHGHKTAARSFDGYKGHMAVDPDSELITAMRVTPGNVADGSVAEELIEDLLDESQVEDEESSGDADSGQGSGPRSEVYGDAAYGTGDLQARLASAGLDSYCKTQVPSNRGGKFPKDEFAIDLETRTVTCPAGVCLPIPESTYESVQVNFGSSCNGCVLREQCTSAARGRSIRIGENEAVLAAARDRQKESEWKERYKATRPKVERKVSDTVKRRHGGRRARVRGVIKVGADWSLLGAATNLARLARLGLRFAQGDWTIQPV